MLLNPEPPGEEQDISETPGGSVAGPFVFAAPPLRVAQAMSKVVCGFSTAIEAQNTDPKSLVKRMPGCRFQTKPGRYCWSITGGVASLSCLSPAAYNVVSENVWPATTCKPQSFQSAAPQSWRIRGL